MKIFNLFSLAVLTVSLVLSSPIDSHKRKCVVRHRNESELVSDGETTEVGDANEVVNPADVLSDYEKSHINALDSYLGECTVLLRKNGDFPLKPSEKSIHLFGNGVRKTIKGGTGSGDVNSHYFANIEEAFETAGYKILSKDFLDAYEKMYKEANTKFREELSKGFDDPMTAMLNTMGATMEEPEYDIPYDKEGDIAIYVLSRISGEGSDRAVKKGDVLLTETESRMIKDLATGFKKFILVLNTGGPVDLSSLDYVENILILSQLGVNTSKALVDVISGAKYPSGKLATTWTRAEDYQTIGSFGENDDTEYKEGIYVGYRYFDSADVDVMFPFGFGLGYTEFKYDVKKPRLSGETFKVDVNVENVGEYKGKEVIQLYLSKPQGKLDEPYQILVSFDKTKELSPKKKDTVHLQFKLSDFASYDTESASYILEKGTYIVRVGNSSRTTVPCGQIIVKKRITVKQLKNKLGKPDFEDYTVVSKKKDSEEELAKAPKFTLKESSIKKTVEKYNKTYPINEAVKKLSLEDKARLVIGDFGEASVTIGAASYSVAGAAGQTVNIAGLKPVIMADGPAGLRLAVDYYEDESGAHSTKSPYAAMAENLSDKLQKMMEASTPKPKEGTEIKHQYATAIPIGTAIAQSWNKKFAQLCGDIVGAEMEKYNVQLWLAPALNIHRSILCGRNFEYYSEDPFISGTFAAAITKGVQKHKNCYVTIKHFAANNQETNRYLNNSAVSERAMREIYLKGFEICVREAQPKAVMTSYNLINGLHTSESKELTNDILRNEFDFNGIVMTDWVMSMPDQKYPCAVSDHVIKAGGDIFMPGNQNDLDRVIKAVKADEITMEQLETSASRIYDLAKSFEN